MNRTIHDNSELEISYIILTKFHSSSPNKDYIKGKFYFSKIKLIIEIGLLDSDIIIHMGSKYTVQVFQSGCGKREIIIFSNFLYICFDLFAYRKS